METRKTRETGILERQGLSSPCLEDCPRILVHQGQHGFQSGMIRTHNVYYSQSRMRHRRKLGDLRPGNPRVLLSPLVQSDAVEMDPQPGPLPRRTGHPFRLCNRRLLRLGHHRRQRQDPFGRRGLRDHHAHIGIDVLRASALLYLAHGNGIPEGTRQSRLLLPPRACGKRKHGGAQHLCHYRDLLAWLCSRSPALVLHQRR